MRAQGSIWIWWDEEVVPASAYSDAVIFRGMPPKTVRRLVRRTSSAKSPGLRWSNSRETRSGPSSHRKAARGGFLIGGDEEGSNSRPSHCERDALPG